MAGRVVPFTSRIVSRNAREILARDRERAQKLLAGVHPHGPLAVRELRSRRHRHGHHGHGGGTASSGGTGGGSAPSGGNGTEPSPNSGAGVDVTDAGVTYTASVGVGSPATQYTLLIDTGTYYSLSYVMSSYV